MSEIAARGSAPRGRGSYRGGRGGHSSRGGRGGSRQLASDKATTTEPALEDQGEIGQLKSKYASSIKIVKEMFPDWTDEDIVFAIEDNQGDLEQTINKMTEGNVPQWESTKKDKAKVPKAKDGISGEATTASGRGSRGRGGADSTRGGRGRATERSRGVSRGARGGSTAPGKPAKTNETETPSTEAAPVADSQTDTAAWAAEVPASTSPATSWEMVAAPELPPVPVEGAKISSKPDGTRTWASIMKPVPQAKPVAVPKVAATPVPHVQEAPTPVPESEIEPEPVREPEPIIPPIIEPSEQIHPSAPPSLPPSESNTVTNVAPSEDRLTEENLELVKDTSHPVTSETVASTMGTEEPRSVIGTPLHGPPTPVARPGLGGFATSALKATQGARASSFRRVKDQQEAVVMPGNHAVDRTAVQFGSLGLSGTDDVDDDREEAETRAQPPQHSPIAPRASLPATAQQPASESSATPRAAPGLPSDLPQVAQSESSTVAQTQAPFDQFSNRLGGLPSAQPSGVTNVSKPYEPFGQQLAGAGHHPFENFSSQSQAPGQQAQAAQSHLGGFGSGYDAYYNDYQRNAQLYGSFGQQPGQPGQESSAAQRGASAFGSSATDSAAQYATSHAPHNRFAGGSDALNSGHSTPAPGTSQPAQSQTQTHSQGHPVGSHGQAGGAPYAGYGQYSGYGNSPFSYMTQPSQHHPQQYGRDRPAFDDARRYEEQQQQYMSSQNQYGYGGYGAQYGNGPYSGGKYGQPQQYGSSYDNHGASPANTFAREQGAASFGYGRSGSAQPESSQQSQHGASAYSGMNDAFTRSASGYPGQTSSQQGQGIPSDENSRFGTDSGKIATGGPSPAPAQQRPNSTNASQSGPQQGQQAYNQYSHNLGAFSSGHQGAHHGGHQGGYSGFGGNAAYGNYGYGGNHRGGWSGYGAGGH